MHEIYYYVDSCKVSDIIDCGLKLSACYDREVNIGGEKKLCFSGLLNPKDDINLYKSCTHTCLKVQVKRDQCFVADRFIYDTISREQENSGLYEKSIVPLEKYIFGTYRCPECLVTTTILAGEASVLDRRMDSPIIYENSEDLYINYILQDFREQYAEFDDYILYNLFNKLAELNKVDKIESVDSDKTVFKSESGRIYCFRRPELYEFFK